MTDATATIPNHHASHPGFSGAGAYVAALSMAFGRDGDAALVARLAAVVDGDVVVDIGCGPGAAVRHASTIGARAIGVEPSVAMRRVARLRGVRAVDGVAEALPVGDGAATVVWSIACVHHWRDLSVGLDEVWRVLAPGGRFVALERSVSAGARGLGSHGWTAMQARSFAERCRARGFVDVTAAEHDTGRRGRGHAVVAVKR